MSLKRLDPRRLHALDQDFRANVGDRVFFSEASAEIGARSRVVLVAQAAWLNRHPDLPVAIEAHADDHGTAAYNEDLAMRRAEAVRARLTDEGVHPDRLTILSLGRHRPVAECSEAACAAQNRRVVTQIVTQRPATAASTTDGPMR